jgi:hypothetical protein
MNQAVSWPQKTRELHSHHFDSTIWNDFRFRDDDIVIATYAKAGTTWVQQIVAQLLFGGDPELAVAEMSPWLDLRDCSFDWMKKHAAKSVPAAGAFWDAGGEVFINKGVNGRWKDVLTTADSAEYEARAAAELGPDCARWLATGEG